MIIYEVILEEGVMLKKGYVVRKVSMFVSNKRKASAFVAQNKKEYSSLEIKKHLVPNNKTYIIKFLNREG